MFLIKLEINGFRGSSLELLKGAHSLLVQDAKNDKKANSLWRNAGLCSGPFLVILYIIGLHAVLMKALQ